MTNKPMPERDAQVIERALSGECPTSIAAGLGISNGRVSQILSRNGLRGRVKDAGLPCIQWNVRQEAGGAWLCSGGGIARRARSAEQAVDRWKAELARKRGRVVEAGIPAPAPVHTVPDPLQLSAAMRQLAARAAAAQPQMLNMGSRVPEGGVR